MHIHPTLAAAERAVTDVLCLEYNCLAGSDRMRDLVGVFVEFDVMPCMDVNDPDPMGETHIIPCDPAEAHYWCHYGMLPNRVPEPLHDDTREECERRAELLRGMIGRAA